MPDITEGLKGQKSNEELLELDKQRIIDEVVRLGIVHRGELVANLMMPPEKIYGMVGLLVREGRLEVVQLPQHFLLKAVARRMQYFWSVGLHWYHNFIRKTWLQVPAMHEDDVHEPSVDIKVKTEVV